MIKINGWLDRLLFWVGGVSLAIIVLTILFISVYPFHPIDFLGDDQTNLIGIGQATPSGQRKSDRQKPIAIEIPKWVEPGKYFIRSVVTYEYFGIRKVEVEYNTPFFEVVE